MDPKPDDPKPEQPPTAEETTQQDEAVVTPTPGEPTTAAAAPGAPVSILPPVAVPQSDTGYTLSGVPTLEGVREKIEARYGTALGATELAEETPECRSAADRYDAMQKAAAEKLDEIRASMHKPEQG